MKPNLSEEPSDYKTEFSSDDPPKNFRQGRGMATPETKTGTKVIGGRLRQFRFGLAEFKEAPRLKTLREFAADTKVDEDNLSNWELGRSVVPYEYVQLLKDKYGVQYLFEWIYGGDASGLSDRLRGLMFKAPKIVAKPHAKTKRKKTTG